MPARISRFVFRLAFGVASINIIMAILVQLTGSVLAFIWGVLNLTTGIFCALAAYGALNNSHPYRPRNGSNTAITVIFVAGAVVQLLTPVYVPGIWIFAGIAVFTASAFFAKRPFNLTPA